MKLTKNEKQEFIEQFTMESLKEGRLESFIKMQCTADEMLAYIESIIAEKVREALNTSKVSRVEVIDKKGRTYVNYCSDSNVKLSLQDDDRTLKIFITTKDNDRTRT